MDRGDAERITATGDRVWSSLDGLVKKMDGEATRIAADSDLSAAGREKALADLRTRATRAANELVSPELRAQLVTAIHQAEQMTPARVARRVQLDPTHHLTLMHDLARDSETDLAARFGDAEAAGDATALRIQLEVLREFDRRGRELPDAAERTVARKMRDEMQKRFSQHLSPDLERWANTARAARDALVRVDDAYTRLTRPAATPTQRLRIARGAPVERVATPIADAPPAPSPRERLVAERRTGVAS